MLNAENRMGKEEKSATQKRKKSLNPFHFRALFSIKVKPSGYLQECELRSKKRT